MNAWTLPDTNGHADIAHAIDSAEPVGLCLKPLELSGLMDEHPAAPGFLIDKIVPRNEVTLLGAHGGAGKSTLMLTLCAHVAAGVQWGPFPVMQCRAVYVSLEDRPEVVRYRLRNIIDAYSLNADAVLGSLSIYDGHDSDAVLAVEVNEHGVRQLEPTPGMARVAEVCHGAGLIVVDNASDAFGGNENARAEVRAFIRMLAKVARSNDAALVLLAHIDKSAAKYGDNQNAYSGSTAWHNSVRSRLALLRDKHGIVLEHQKTNYGALAEPVRLAFIAHGVLWPQDPSVEQANADARDRADDAAVVKALTSAALNDVSVPTATSGPSTAWRVLDNAGLLADEYTKPEGRKRFNGAVSRLLKSGRLARETHQTPARHERQRLVVSAPLRQCADAPIPPIPPSALARALEQRADADSSKCADTALAHIGALAQNGSTEGAKPDIQEGTL